MLPTELKYNSPVEEVVTHHICSISTNMHEKQKVIAHELFKGGFVSGEPNNTYIILNYGINLPPSGVIQCTWLI